MHCVVSSFTRMVSESTSCRCGTASLAASSILHAFEHSRRLLTNIINMEESWQDSPHLSLLYSGIYTGCKEQTSGVLDGSSPARAPSPHTPPWRCVMHREVVLFSTLFYLLFLLRRWRCSFLLLLQMFRKCCIDFTFIVPLVSPLFSFVWMVFPGVQTIAVAPPQ